MTKEKPLRIGILGGTFNPVHFGHLRAAEEIAEELDLETVFFVPAARPPHKTVSPLASIPDRLAMVRLAVTGRRGFEVSDLETRRTGPSYTVDTLSAFIRDYGPGLDLFFLTGLDAVLEVGSWKDYARLFELASFVVFSRPGYDASELGPLLRSIICDGYTWNEERGAFSCQGKKDVYFRPITQFDVSSTDIRGMLKKGRSVRYLIPEAVREYIIENGLYRE